MAQNTASYSVEDYDREKSRFSVNLGPLTLANFAAKRAAVDALAVATLPLIRGELRSISISESFTESVADVDDPEAQRESKWLVTMRDATEFFDALDTISNPGFGNLFNIEIPTANLALLPLNSDELDLTDTEVAAFVTALEAAANSPNGGETVEVVRIRHVGRNI